MSKIEKALRKARERGVVQLVSQSRAVGRGDEPVGSVEESAGQALVRTDVGSAETTGRAEAALAIAQMRELAPMGRGNLETNRIIFRDMEDSRVVEAFRQIRTAVIQKTQGRNAILLVTSVVPEGGSSFVSMNLGVAFSFDAGKTALVVDCNLRRSGLSRFFAHRECKGLTDFMENEEVDVGEILHQIGIERLRVIPAGEPREIPAEHFTSVKMRQLLDGLKKRYRERYVILDAPPMTELADIQILTELSDLVMLVVPYGRVTTAQLKSCIETIDAKKFFGVIFNGEPEIPTFQWRTELKVLSKEIGGRLARLVTSVAGWAKPKKSTRN